MKIIGIDLFSGAGGMSIGAAWAGVDVRIAVEADVHAASTYAVNHPAVKVIVDDVRSIRAGDLSQNGHSVVLFGGPPCQGFSTSNQRTRNRKNPTNWLFREFVRVAQTVSPDWIVFENVRGLVETENGLFLNRIIRAFKKLGYATTWWTLNAADYGVPQIRSRLFVIGSKGGILPEKPRATKRRHVTVWAAISDLPVLRNGDGKDIRPYRCEPDSAYAKNMRRQLRQSSGHLVTRNAKPVIHRYKHVIQGGNWECIPARLMRNYTDRTRCHTGIYHRLRADAPSVVIGNFRKNMLIHPFQNRGLSVREAARLQSFPDSYQFKGSIGFQQQQVGNAVPPLLAKAVFASVLRAAGKSSSDRCLRKGSRACGKTRR